MLFKRPWLNVGWDSFSVLSKMLWLGAIFLSASAVYSHFTLVCVICIPESVLVSSVLGRRTWSIDKRDTCCLNGLYCVTGIRRYLNVSKGEKLDWKRILNLLHLQCCRMNDVSAHWCQHIEHFPGGCHLPPHIMLEKKARIVVNLIVDIVVETFCHCSRESIFEAFGVTFDVTCVCEVCAHASLAERLFLKTFEVQKKPLLMEWRGLRDAVLSISLMVLVV